MPKIAIIGAGFVGLKCYETLSKITSCVCTVKTQESYDRLKNLNIPVIILDGSQKEALAPLYEETEALVIAVAPSHNGSYEETYLKLAENISQNIDKFKHIKQIIAISSTSVYAEEKGSKIDEESPLNEHETHAKILVDTEKLYQLLNKKVKVCLVRLGEIYGRERSLESKLRMSQGKELPSDGSNPVNLSHVDDVINFIAFAIKSDIQGVYNLVAEEHPSRKELYSKLSHLYHLKMPVFNANLPQRHGRSKIVTSNKIRSTGWAPEFDRIEY